MKRQGGVLFRMMLIEIEKTNVDCSCMIYNEVKIGTNENVKFVRDFLRLAETFT